MLGQISVVRGHGHISHYSSWYSQSPKACYQWKVYTYNQWFTTASLGWDERSGVEICDLTPQCLYGDLQQNATYQLPPKSMHWLSPGNHDLCEWCHVSFYFNIHGIVNLPAPNACFTNLVKTTRKLQMNAVHLAGNKSTNPSQRNGGIVHQTFRWYLKWRNPHLYKLYGETAYGYGKTHPQNSQK